MFEKNGMNYPTRFQLKYQGVAAFIAFALTLIFVFSESILKVFPFFGDLSTYPSPIAWLGISGNESWRELLVSLSFTITSVTFAFMYLGSKKMGISYFRSCRRHWHWILLFSLTNAVSEELVFRFVVLGAANSLVNDSSAIWISAVVFGVAHIRGAPGGVLGIILASALGLILGKATLETGGIGVAIWIHFLQDLVIFPVVLSSNSIAHPEV